jgi:hypothetical protein
MQLMRFIPELPFGWTGISGGAGRDACAKPCVRHRANRTDLHVRVNSVSFRRKVSKRKARRQTQSSANSGTLMVFIELLEKGVRLGENRRFALSRPPGECEFHECLSKFH